MQQTENRATDDIFRLNFSLPGTELLGVVVSIICTAIQGRCFPRRKVPGLCQGRVLPLLPSEGVRESDMKSTVSPACARRESVTGNQSCLGLFPVI